MFVPRFATTTNQRITHHRNPNDHRRQEQQKLNDVSLEQVRDSFFGEDYKPQQFNQEHDKVVKVVDSLIAEEFTSLSIEEREKTYEQLHGVDDLIQETPEFLAATLAALDWELQKISKKPAYDVAKAQDPAYVSNPKFRLTFLRADYFRPQKAAERLVAFLEGKLKYFGKSLLTKRINLNDLDKDDRDCLKYGQMQILPRRDSAGRAVFCDMNMVKDLYFRAPINRLRCFLYSLLTLVEDEENQKRGVVVVLFQLGNVDPRQVNLELARENPGMLKWIPMRVNCLHFCLNDPILETLARITLAGSHPDIRARHRIHAGTYVEVMYSLMSYGIPVDLFPMNSDEVIKTTNHNRWMARRKLMDNKGDSEEDPSSIIELPTRHDVLTGKGRPIQHHPGNVRFRDIVDQHMDEYNATKKGSKAIVIRKVINAVLESSGRFLAKTKQGWWQVASDQEARDKVAKLFLTTGTKLKNQECKGHEGAFQRQPAAPRPEYYENTTANDDKTHSLFSSSPYQHKRLKCDPWDDGCCGFSGSSGRPHGDALIKF